ncbi:metal ABC transporter ATP-binding protein [Rossellomorea marisflavi]|uniref:metal ABC transporter ATP-binding protein n=1 Tax=Rossellomorea marisflavi TaxID=189381 RepID=UPI00207A7EEC|nr:metal ABC transporter ATP-binding protein [Rossellomorea marisflavi]USK93007.1 metal ABC transporter ATP-binding protein [Rossellomorea marisflavi]
MNMIELKNVSFKYENEWILEQVNFTVRRGQFIGLVGPNGSGKSTLLNLLLGLLKADSGSIRLLNQPIRHFKNWEEIGYISQKSNSFNSGFPASVKEVVRSGLTSRVGKFRFFNKIHRAKVMDALREVGMERYVRSHIGELSGGQQQRVFIARTLISEPSLLVLDEPTVGVDAKHVDEFYDLLTHLHMNKDLTLLMITHDMDRISHYASHVVHLDGALQEKHPYNSFFDTERRLHTRV